MRCNFLQAKLRCYDLIIIGKKDCKLIRHFRKLFHPLFLCICGQCTHVCMCLHAFLGYLQWMGSWRFDGMKPLWSLFHSIPSIILYSKGRAQDMATLSGQLVLELIQCLHVLWVLNFCLLVPEKHCKHWAISQETF